jgi:predicted alpha/beta-hydrolase family hydrolase
MVAIADRATHRQAAFAFQLAREVTGRIMIAYRAGKDSRDGLMLDPVFAAAFTAAKARIREMEYRYVEDRPEPPSSPRNLLRPRPRHTTISVRTSARLILTSVNSAH